MTSAATTADEVAEGAKAATTMTRRRGRSSYLGERAHGHGDGDGEAVAIVLQALSDAGYGRSS